MLTAATTLRLTSTPTVRMVDWVTAHTTVNRALAPMTTATRFTQNHLGMIQVTDLSNGRIANFNNPTNLPRRQPNQSVAVTPRH